MAALAKTRTTPAPFSPRRRIVAMLESALWADSPSNYPAIFNDAIRRARTDAVDTIAGLTELRDSGITDRRVLIPKINEIFTIN